MANPPKLLSGRVLVTPYSDLTNSRHEFLGLGQAEPNLGPGSDGSILTISTDNQRVFSNTVTVSNNTATITNLTVNGNLVANSIQLGAGIYQWSKSYVYFATTVSATLQTLYSVPVANISGAEFHIIATDVTTGIRQSTKISSVVYDEQVQFTEYAGLYVNGEAGVFQINYAAGDLDEPAALQLKVTPGSSNQTIYKLLITLFSE